MFETSLAIPFICANGTGIEQGTLLKLSDPFTVSAATAVNDKVGGIAAAEKIANDGLTTIPTYRSGIFRGTADGPITVNDALVFSGNKLFSAAVNAENIAGTAFETAADSDTFVFELRPFAINLA